MLQVGFKQASSRLQAGFKKSSSRFQVGFKQALIKLQVVCKYDLSMLQEIFKHTQFQDFRSFRVLTKALFSSQGWIHGTNNEDLSAAKMCWPKQSKPSLLLKKNILFKKVFRFQPEQKSEILNCFQKQIYKLLLNSALIIYLINPSDFHIFEIFFFSSPSILPTLWQDPRD